jgi:hypothetical protein
MIFNNDYLEELRSTGINSHNLKYMVLSLARKCQEFERNLKDGDNTEKQAPSSSKAAETS